MWEKISYVTVLLPSVNVVNSDVGVNKITLLPLSGSLFVDTSRTCTYVLAKLIN